MTLGFYVTIWYFANGRPGGQLISGDGLGNWWSYGSIVLLAVIILFPRLRPKTWSKNASGHR